MNANAMVIIARYGPLARSAGSANKAPITPVRRPASRNATQKLTPFTVRIAAV
jgi:hypothetical protein